MVASLPSGLVAIDAAIARGFGTFNIIGLVVDELPARPSGGSSFSCTFTLLDTDFSRDAWDGLKVRFFRDVESELPCPNRGDVVLLRNIRLRDYRGQVIGSVGQKDTATWCVLSPSHQDPSGVSVTKSSTPTSRAEQLYALSLLNHETDPKTTGPSVSSPAPAPASRQTVSSRTTSQGAVSSQKFSLIKDLQFGKFADIVGQVVKTFAEDYNRFTLYVTDYTSNKDLFNYLQEESGEGRDGDEFGYLSRRPQRQWPGPFGRRTIQVTLWDPHAGYARGNIKEDDFVLLENVQVKYGRDVAMMEGALRTDRMYPDKVRVRVIDEHDHDERVQEVVRRKLEYWKQVGGRSAPKRQGAEDGQNGTSKSKKQKQKEREKLRRQKEKQEKEQREVPEQPKLATALAKRNELNRLIRASHPATPCRSIQDILENESHKHSAPGGVEYTLPFQNLCYRASVRVVDFFPPVLEDFAVRYSRDRARLGHVDSDTDDDGGGGGGGGRGDGWEWRFCLLVEDAGPGSHYNHAGKRERMKLFVAGEGAVFLLKMDATDLREDDTALAMLREKLFILWGNLEELKAKNPEMFYSDEAPAELSTKPFKCCIKEYGVPSTNADIPTSDDDGTGEVSLGWERRFQMFETTIDE